MLASTQRPPVQAGEPRMRLTDRKRRAVIDAAAAEFQRDGFDRASMNRIAAAAGVSKRTVYKHFASKEAGFEAIIAELMQRLGKLEGIEYDPSASLETQLRALGKAWVRQLTSDEFLKLARVVVSRFMDSPEIAAATIGAREDGKAALVRWIKAAKNDGRLGVGNPARAAREFAGLIQEFVFWPQLLGSEQALSPREVNHVVATATKMFLALYAK